MTINRSVMNPKAPIMTMPTIARSVRERLRPSMITEPRPVGTPVISPTTIRIHAKLWPSRRPLKIAGMDAGSTIWRNIAEPEQPSMILGETALSFLGLGLRPPVTSWGVLLNEAQNINVVALYPWLMLPVVPVFIVVLAFNFFGDGLRDAADPYK